jgi:heme A synthase
MKNTKIKFLGATGGITLKNPLSKVNNLEDLLALFIEAIVKLGSVVVVFMIIYSGFLFVKAQGNENELTKAKNTFLWTVIGAVILLGARAIAAMVQGTAAQFGI